MSEHRTSAYVDQEAPGDDPARPWETKPRAYWRCLTCDTEPVEVEDYDAAVEAALAHEADPAPALPGERADGEDQT